MGLHGREDGTLEHDERIDRPVTKERFIVEVEEITGNVHLLDNLRVTTRTYPSRVKAQSIAICRTVALAKQLAALLNKEHTQ